MNRAKVWLRDWWASPYLNEPPISIQRSPYQTVLMAIALLGAPALIQGNPGSQVLADAIPHNLTILWGWCLTAGSLLIVVGSYWPRRTDRNEVIGFALERAGAILVGGAALVYALVLSQVVPDFHDNARTLFLLQVGFALASFLRAVQITRRLSWRRNHPQRG